MTLPVKLLVSERTHTSQDVVNCVVGQISAIAAPGSRLCLDLIPRGLLEGRVKPTRGFTNGRDVRPEP